jgi:hypothetical protein
LAGHIESESRGAVEVELVQEYLDRWPQQKPVTIDWYRDPPTYAVLLKRLTNFKGWGNNDNTVGHSDTYPGYPHIAISDTTRYKIDMATEKTQPPQPNPLPTDNFNYQDLFTMSVRGRSVLDWVNSGDATELWLFGDPTARFLESKVAKPVGDLFKAESQGCPLPVPGLNRRVYMMGFNYALPTEYAVHSFGHRIEDMMTAAWQGPRQVTCEANVGEGLNHHFARIWRCYQPASRGVNFGSMGTIHKAFNAPYTALNRDDINSPDLVNFRSLAPSDEEEWYEFPNFLPGGSKPDTNCEDWSGCAEPGESGDGDRGRYYLWWFDHVPRNAGQTEGVWNNMWAYVIHPGCFPDLQSAPPIPGYCP